MKIRTSIVVDSEDGRAPVKHEIWSDIERAEVQEFKYPQLHPFADDFSALVEHQKQMDRHQRFVDMLSHQIATALGRALGNK